MNLDDYRISFERRHKLTYFVNRTLSNPDVCTFVSISSDEPSIEIGCSVGKDSDNVMLTRSEEKQGEDFQVFA
jgi:hypothetical protein